MKATEGVKTKEQEPCSVKATRIGHTQSSSKPVSVPVSTSSLNLVLVLFKHVESIELRMEEGSSTKGRGNHRLSPKSSYTDDLVEKVSPVLQSQNNNGNFQCSLKQ